MFRFVATTALRTALKQGRRFYGLSLRPQWRNGPVRQRKLRCQRVDRPQLAHDAIHDAARRAAGEQVGRCAVVRRLALERGAVDGAGSRFRAQFDGGGRAENLGAPGTGTRAMSFGTSRPSRCPRQSMAAASNWRWPAISVHSSIDVPCFGAVSYTHLDVYKRQILGCCRHRSTAGS